MRRRIVILGIILFAIFSAIFAITRQNNLSDGDIQVIQGFIEWFGVVYGLLLAMIIVEVWTKHNHINSEIDKEADALYLLLKTAGYSNDKIAYYELIQIIHNYATFVTSVNNGYDKHKNEVQEHLKELYEGVKRLIKEVDSQAIAYELIHRVNEVVDARGDWVARTKEHIPRQLWLLLVVASIVWLVSFLGLKIETFLLSLAIIGSAVFVVTAILYIAADLDNPKDGLWTPKFDSFEDVLEETSKLLALS